MRQVSVYPHVGFQFSNHYASTSSYVDALSPLFDRLSSSKKATFQVDNQDLYSITLTTDDGFQYSVNPNAISVGFIHRMKLKNISGGHPTVEMLSKPQPFSKLLPEVCSRLIEVSELLVDIKSRKVKQVGIVTTTWVDEKDAPPGIIKFINHIKKPWPLPFDAYTFQLTAQLNNSEEWRDRCIHEITKSENEDEPAVVKFDWQRKCVEPLAIPNINMLVKILDSAQKGALDYFEELAHGDRFDE